MEPLALGVKDAAAYISLSRSRLYELISEGSIEARKLGARTVVPVASLQAYVANAPRLSEAAWAMVETNEASAKTGPGVQLGGEEMSLAEAASAQTF